MIIDTRYPCDEWHTPPKKLLGSGVSTPYTPFCLICTIISELKRISFLYQFEWAGVDICWFLVDGFDTRWIPSSFSCGMVYTCQLIIVMNDIYVAKCHIHNASHMCVIGVMKDTHMIHMCQLTHTISDIYVAKCHIHKASHMCVIGAMKDTHTVHMCHWHSWTNTPLLGHAMLWRACCSVCCSMCCSMCCSVCCSVLQCVAVCCSVWQCVAVCCSVLQCIAVYCSVLQCVAVCCSVL